MLPSHIFPEGMSHHAMLGNIFNPKDGTKMEEEITQEEIVRIYNRDENGNPIKVKVY